MSTPVDFNSPALSGRASRLQHYTSLAVILFGAIALLFPSGYSLGPALLLLASPVLLVTRPRLGLERRDWAIMGVLMLYGGLWILEVWWDGQGSRGLDKPIRFFLAAPVLLLLLAYPPRMAAVWLSAALAAIGTGSFAAWQKLVLGMARADGHTQVIQFGNSSMLFGILCLGGLGWAVCQPRSRRWVALLVLGALFGFMGSLFSGSRGGWIGLPFVALALYKGYGRYLALRYQATLAGLLLVVAGLAYAIPHTGVADRIDHGISDVQRYISGESRTSSLGARFEMWRAAAIVIPERPLTGWGENGYIARAAELVDEERVGVAVARYSHVHNEVLDITVKRGLLGLATLLLLYFVPMRLFGRQISSKNLELRAFSVSGVLLCVAYIDFGLSQVFFAHNSGVMLFSFWLVILWASMRRLEASPDRRA
ncbi:O-antigen ligase family protein [Halomonas mongoliensis]|uniref:O-antigen ligase family protein n=1 Tax=Halomonas mongoliensis TaxID=321265 RepID=UPI00403B0589